MATSCYEMPDQRQFDRSDFISKTLETLTVSESSDYELIALGVSRTSYKYDSGSSAR